MAQNNLAYEYYGSNAAPQLVPQKAPKKRPEEPKKPNLRKVGKKKASVRNQERASHAAVAKFSVVIVLCIIAFAVMCNSFSQVRAARLELQSQQDTLAIYQNQKNELDARLAKMVAVDKLEKIAVERLGMIKLSEANKIYVNTAAENEIIISGETD